MKFVALVSGGKDSCFNILHCLKQGHELVALANLYPRHDQGQADELDSWMYQTVGYQAVEKYGEAIGVPLYRRCIEGTNKVQGLQYQEASEDETEDLRALLEEVQRHHPDIEAVSSGAILSSYQRIRVENVCTRLKLVSLAYMWQRPQSELLDEIIASGLDARLIKTAGAGLDRSHLGKSLGQLRPVLQKLNDMYELHLCGEGGEYETLVLDGPFFKKKLVITDRQVVDHSNGDVSYLSLRVGLEDKEPFEWDASAVQEPDLLEEEFTEILEKAQMPLKLPLKKAIGEETLETETTGIEQTTHRLQQLNIRPIEPSASLEDQAQSVFDQIALKYESIAYISLLLADMKDFAVVNSIYQARLGKINPPPARMCIAVEGLVGKLQLSALATVSIPTEPNPRLGLHVQSRSYWAPANIGPYSQQISNGEGLSFLAGQIGLIPSSMELANGSLLQGILALQNLTRVSRATDSNSRFISMMALIGDREYVPAAQKILDSWLRCEATTATKPIIVVVKGLPKGAAIEFTAMGIESNYWQRLVYDDDEDTLIWPPRYFDFAVPGVDVSGTRFGHYSAYTIAATDLVAGLEYCRGMASGVNGKQCVYSAVYYTGEKSAVNELAGEQIPAETLCSVLGSNYCFAHLTIWR